MTRRSRVISYGSAAASIVAGVLCGTLIGGAAGSILAIVLVGVGLIALLSLAFLEVGLSEDRERERAVPRTAARPASTHRPPAPTQDPARLRPLRPLRPDRARGRRRRLR